MPRTRIDTLPLPRLENPAARLLVALSTALTRRRERALLARLDPHLLRDIGLDADQAARECAKPFWQA